MESPYGIYNTLTACEFSSSIPANHTHASDTLHRRRSLRSRGNYIDDFIPSAWQSKPVVNNFVQLLGVEVVLTARILAEKRFWDESGEVSCNCIALYTKEAWV